MAARASEVEATVGVGAHGLFRIVERPSGVGFGAFACAPIPAGAVICEDYPLLVLRGGDIGVRDLVDRTPADYRAYHARAPAVLLAQYKALSSADQRKVSELYDCYEERVGAGAGPGDNDPDSSIRRKMLLVLKQKTLGISEGAAAEMYSSDGDAAPGVSGTKSVFGIFQTNAIPQGEENAQGLYPLISRFNHSCVNSAVYQWRDALQTNVVTATRDIAAGEEICVSYFKSLYMTRGERARRTAMTWGFKCQCPACEVVPKEHQKEFEATSARIRQLVQDDPTLEDGDVLHLIPPEHQRWMNQGADSDERRERLWRLNSDMERAPGLRAGMRILQEMQELYEEEGLLPGLSVEAQLAHDRLSLLAIYGGSAGDLLEESRNATRELCRLEELLHGKEGNKELEKYARWRDGKRGAPTAQDFQAGAGSPSLGTPGGMQADACPTQ